MSRLLYCLTFIYLLSYTNAQTTLALSRKVHNYLDLLEQGPAFIKVGKSAAQKATRAVRASNVGLTGNLYQIETTITIGSQNQEFEVVVDTGSTLLAVPATTCTRCDSDAPDPALNVAQSSTSQLVACNSSLCNAGASSCTKDNLCGFRVTFADSSSITGGLVEDTVSVNGLTTPAEFGIILSETSNFEAPFADGIMGLAYNNPSLSCSPNCVTPFFDTLVASSGIPNRFSIELDYSGSGQLSLGVSDTTGFTFTDIIDKSLYIVKLDSLEIDGQTLVSGESHFGTTFIDSGSSLINLAPATFQAFQNYMQTSYCNLPLVCGDSSLFENFCLTDLNDVNSFPTLTFNFGGVAISVSPLGYLPATPVTGGNTGYCLGIASGADGETALGDSFMRGKTVLFDRVGNQLGFSSTDGSVAAYSSAISLSASSTILMSLFVLFILLL